MKKSVLLEKRLRSFTIRRTLMPRRRHAVSGNSGLEAQKAGPSRLAAAWKFIYTREMIDVHWLNVFRKVYECKSFSRAGEALAISQPTVSAHVASLEKAVGMELFFRQGRRVVPTPAAELMYARSADIFLHLASLEKDVRLLDQSGKGQLRLQASSIPGIYLAPQYLKDFCARFPHMTVRLEVSNTSAVVQAVAQGFCSLGFTGSKLEGPDLAYEAIYMDEVVVVAAPDCPGVPLSGVPLQEARELGRFDWIMRPAGSGTWVEFSRSMQARGLTLNSLRVRYEAEDAQTVLALALQGLGVAAVSSLAARPYLESGALRQLQVRDVRVLRPVYMLRNLRRPGFFLEKTFWEHVREKRKDHGPV